MDRVCAIIDFDGYHIKKCGFLCREFGYIGIDWTFARSIHFDLTSMRSDMIPKDWKNVRYVEKRITGLPFLPLKGESACSYGYFEEVIQDFYNQMYTKEKDIIAYKGGHVEKDVLNKLNIPSLNLEEYGCPKFDILNSNGHYNLTCGKHTLFNGHCPRAEVKAFQEWCLSTKV